MARKTNITGIKGLSIGSTKNNRGYSMTRYTVNHKTEAGKYKAKSFYFGRNCSQKEAFSKAIEYMLENDLIEQDIDSSAIYIELKHETLV